MTDCLACVTWPRTLTIMTYLSFLLFLPFSFSLFFFFYTFLDVCRRYASTRQACFSDFFSHRRVLSATRRLLYEKLFSPFIPFSLRNARCCIVRYVFSCQNTLTILTFNISIEDIKCQRISTRGNLYNRYK